MRIVHYFFYSVAILMLLSLTSNVIHGTYSGSHENGSQYILVLDEDKNHELSIHEEHLHSHFKGEYYIEDSKLYLQNEKVTVVDKRVKKPTMSNNSDVIVFHIKGDKLWDEKEKICLTKKN